MTIESINPATEDVLARFEEQPWAHVDEALARAFAARKDWQTYGVPQRSSLIGRLAARLRQEKACYAGLVTAEMGKPIVEAEAEIEKCAWAADWFVEHAGRLLASRAVETAAAESYISFQPIGVVLAVMPWNFPFWQVMRAAIPALMAGNVMLLKHASNVPQSAIAIEEAFRAAGFPAGVFQTLLVGSGTVQRIIEDPRVAAVTMTGSELAGAQVAAAAGRNLKKSVLELGGSDPFMVLEDADVKLAATVACRARNQNGGQSCIAAKRFIVVDSIADAFVSELCRAVAGLRVGDPSNRDVNLGPLARRDLVDDLNTQIRESVNLGAQVVVGGKPSVGRGFYFQPTVVTHVDASMRLFREETFGPAAAVVRVGSTEEAIAVANDSKYGLGASLWTADIENAKRCAEKIEAGLVYVNRMVASDPRLPFGGVKHSGYGRELGEFGLTEFTNVQAVSIERSR